VRIKKMGPRIAELDKDLAQEKTRNDTLQELLEPAFGAKIRRNRPGPAVTESA